MRRPLCFLPLLAAAHIAVAAEVTLSFPDHWTQKGDYCLYTPERCPPGCVAIAGAAIVQYHKVAQGPAPTSNVCTFNGEPRTLATKSETYDWAAPDIDDYARLAYNLGVRLGMYYESNSSHTAFAKLENVLDGYGLTATHVACVSGTPSEADYARLIRAPLRLGWPVALSIGGELTTHAVVATGFNDAGETRIFNGYASQGWDTLPNVYDPGVIAYVALASSASQLGFQYGDRYGRVPDSWLEAYFSDLLMQGSSLQTVDEGDFDGDGFLNWEEYVAGTDPRDAASRFRVTRLTVENGKPTIEWAPNLPNRAYTLQGKATLDDAWQSPPGADARFFRVLVTAPAD